jgi:hypothetical protein
VAETERISLAAMGRILLGLSVRKLGGAMSFPNAGISYLQLAVESIGVRWISAVSRLLVSVAGVTEVVLSVLILLIVGIVWGDQSVSGKIDWKSNWCQSLRVWFRSFRMRYFGRRGRGAAAAEGFSD